MSVRKMLGADVGRIHEQVDAIVDSQDGVIVLVDGTRAISYAHGFGISPCQLELLMLEIEKAVRAVGGQPTNNRRNYGEQSDDSGSGAGVRRHLDRLCGGRHGRVVDRGGESVRIGGSADGNRGIAAGCVLRLAREAAATDAG